MTMNGWNATMMAAAMVIASVAGAQTSAPAPTQQQRQQDLKGAESTQQRDSMIPVTAAQQAQYTSEYQAAKAKWAALTPEQKSATIAAARTKKLSELSAIELVGQRNDMLQETAAQSAQLKSEAAAAKAKWDGLSAGTEAGRAQIRLAEEARRPRRDGGRRPARRHLHSSVLT
jgi:hypothetical protein